MRPIRRPEGTDLVDSGSDFSSAPADDAVDAIAQQLHTILDMLRFATSRFGAGELVYGHGTDNAVDEATALVLHALDLPPDIPESLIHGRLTMSEKRHVLRLVERRVQERLPLAYLTRRAWFAGLEFYVDERVLVPRSPIAELLEQGLAPWIERPEQVRSVLDLCTGSGCIGIASAFAFAEASVELADISADALEVAAINIERFALQDRVSTVQSDVFSGLQGRTYDLILCNPPYVPQAEFDGLPTEYTHEPGNGLVAGDDGLDVVRTILQQAHQHLSDDGLLVVEVGDTASVVSASWPQLPFTWLEFERGGSGVFALSAMDTMLMRMDEMTAPATRARED